MGGGRCYQLGGGVLLVIIQYCRVLQLIFRGLCMVCISNTITDKALTAMTRRPDYSDSSSHTYCIHNFHCQQNFITICQIFNFAGFQKCNFRIVFFSFSMIFGVFHQCFSHINFHKVIIIFFFNKKTVSSCPRIQLYVLHLKMKHDLPQIYYIFFPFKKKKKKQTKCYVKQFNLLNVIICIYDLIIMYKGQRYKDPWQSST